MRVSHLRVYLLYLFAIVIVTLLVFELAVFFKISRDRRMSVSQKSVENYEDLFCGQGIRMQAPLSSDKPCPDKGIITAFKHRPLCLNMWRYANLIAGTYITGLKAYVPMCMTNALSSVFTNLTLPNLSEIGHCDFPNISASASSILEWTGDEKQSIVVSWTDLFNYAVVEHLDEIKSHFVFNWGLKTVAEAMLSKASATGRGKKVTYVGIYITKTSMVAQQEYDNIYPSVQFFLDAMNHYRRHYVNPAFVVIAENAAFWQRRIRSRDVVLVDKNIFSSEASILSVLAHCNHSILGFPDCAMWGAMFTGGDAVVSLSLADEYSSILQSYPNWNYLEKNNRSMVFDEKFFNRKS